MAARLSLHRFPSTSNCWYSPRWCPRLLEAARSKARHGGSRGRGQPCNPSAPRLHSPPACSLPAQGRADSCRRLRPLPGTRGCCLRTVDWLPRKGNPGGSHCCQVPCCRHRLRVPRNPFPAQGSAVSPHPRAGLPRPLLARLQHPSPGGLPSSRALRIGEAPGPVPSFENRRRLAGLAGL